MSGICKEQSSMQIGQVAQQWLANRLRTLPGVFSTRLLTRPARPSVVTSGHSAGHNVGVLQRVHPAKRSKPEPEVTIWTRALSMASKERSIV
jgi:hypothetical protein